MPVMVHKRLWGALWVALAVTSPGLAQSDLKLPSSDEDYRELLDEQRSGPCDRCGVVTAIRTQTHAGPRPRSRAPAVAPGLTTAPIIGTGSAVADARQANAPVTTYNSGPLRKRLEACDRQRAAEQVALIGVATLARRGNPSGPRFPRPRR
jgi:hypothetical protein